MRTWWDLHWHLGHVRAFENFIDVGRCPPVEVEIVRSIRHEAPVRGEEPEGVNCRRRCETANSAMRPRLAVITGSGKIMMAPLGCCPNALIATSISL